MIETKYPVKRLFNDNTLPANSVYVKNLPPEADELEVKEIFDSNGEIENIQIFRNEIGKSSGLAIVTFFKDEDACSAINSNNGRKVGKYTISCEMYLENNNFESTRVNTVVVKNLPENFSKGDVKRLFFKYGILHNLCLLTESSKHSKMAFFSFATDKLAIQAIAEMNGRIVDTENSRALEIKPSTNFGNNHLSPQVNINFQKNPNPLFYPPYYVQMPMLNYCQNNMYNPYYMYPPPPSPYGVPGVNEGGYIPYVGGQDGGSYFQQDFGYKIPGNEPVFPPPESPGVTKQQQVQQQENGGNQKFITPNLFVFHLPQNYGDTHLFKLFKRFGKIVSVKVIKYRNGSSKGYGFVLFENIEHAMQAIEKMDGRKVENKYLKVSFKTRKQTEPVVYQ